MYTPRKFSYDGGEHMRNRVSRRAFLQVAASGAMVGGLDSHFHRADASPQAKPAAPDWSLNATIIEACSCTMFCPCYFSTVPSGHSHESMAVDHYCRFNMAHKVNKGNFGDV